MNHMIENYIQNLSKEQIEEFALKNGVTLSSSELDFTLQFIKKNGMELLKNPNHFQLEKYKSQYSEENYQKMQKLLPIYFQKYHRFLNTL